MLVITERKDPVDVSLQIQQDRLTGWLEGIQGCPLHPVMIKPINIAAAAKVTKISLKLKMEIASSKVSSTVLSTLVFLHLQSIRL